MSPSAAVLKMFPSRFKRITRASGHRIYGLEYSADAAGLSRAARPSWQLSDYDGDYNESWRLLRR